LNGSSSRLHAESFEKTGHIQGRFIGIPRREVGAPTGSPGTSLKTRPLRRRVRRPRGEDEAVPNGGIGEAYFPSNLHHPEKTPRRSVQDRECWDRPHGSDALAGSEGLATVPRVPSFAETPTRRLDSSQTPRSSQSPIGFVGTAGPGCRTGCQNRFKSVIRMPRRIGADSDRKPHDVRQKARGKSAPVRRS
jgi:hypothetical protein